jgi:Skp family chaperone for outer membrane proteins
MEPIKLRDLVQSLATIMVGTGKYLDQANVELRNLYFASGSEALADLTPPRFTLDEVAIDLAFVVQEAKVVGPDSTSFKPADLKPVALEKPERDELLAALKGKTDVLQKQHSDELKGIQAELVKAIQELERTQGDRAALRAQLAQLGPKPANPLRAMEWLKKKKQLDDKLQTTQASLTTKTAGRGDIQRRLNEVSRRPVPDYVGLWEQFEGYYRQEATIYAEARLAYSERRLLPKIGPQQPPAAALVDLVDSPRFLSAALKKKVHELFHSHQLTRLELGKLVKVLTDLQTEGIHVRVDANSLAEAPEPSRQRMRLTFRSQTQETVNVEGQQVDLR